MTLLELNSDEIISAIGELQKEYESEGRGLEIVRVEDGYQLASKKEYHEYLYPMLSKQAKPTLSQASLEVLSIIAYNSRATKADVDAIRGETGLRVDVTLCEPESLPRSEGKAVRVIDERNFD